MANVADFSIILDGNANVTVGNVFTRTFATERVLRGGEKAVLFLTARGLAGDVSVLVNGQNIGQIGGSGSNNLALAQTIVFTTDILRGASLNAIEVTATPQSGNFGLTDLVCLFRQSTG